MDIIPLVSIPALYVLAAVLRPRLKKILGRGPCAICAAVSLTWLVLAGMWLLGLSVSEEVIGILMGMSVAGLMYKLEPVYKKYRIRNFWFVRLVLIVGGFYAVLFFLRGRWDALVSIAVFSALAIFIATFLFQGVTHEDAVSEIRGKSKRSLVKKLEDCC